ncbi:unnamed protein product [Durusdinium trenchii]|uniref:Glutamine amidotransferase type-2 domain-containing protein n=1 Tax=Durusdinium trenchii TaxID=1381693 RepID=A0ABP0SC78_9DINO
MCSFLVTTWVISNFTAVNFFLRPRGPDGTHAVQKGPFTFVHNLLHMTGERVFQPFVDGEAVAVYNGEIYNSRQVPSGFSQRHSYRSDGECLLPCYRHHGASFPKILDGEWALVLVDFSAMEAIVSTDVFGTKPLWYSWHKGFHAASYKSALLGLGIPERHVQAAAPNQVLRLQLSFAHDEVVQVNEVARYSVHEFDLRQFKTSTEDWQMAFRRAVWKRIAASNHPVFVGLSSGYDSGALHLALESEAPDHSATYFTVAAEELPQIIKQRLAVHNKSVARAFKISLSLQDFHSETSWLHSFSEPSKYGRSNWAGGSVQEDGAAAGLSSIFRLCRSAGILVYISGAGADEIISDYGFSGKKFFPHSSFGGQFPEDLSSLFPWQSVFLGTQRDYLMKEEVVAGSHGLEARYPFLDRAVVQEFLWLSHNVKNEIYKRPVHDFLAAANYPFDVGNKDGFAAGRNLKLFHASSISILYDSIAQIQSATASLESISAPSCVSGPRRSTWQEARSQMVTFLSTPSDNMDVIEHLGVSLLSLAGEMATSEDMAEDCPLGRVCLQLLMLLLAEPGARSFFLQTGADDFLQVLDPSWLQWSTIVVSGWPLFELFYRISQDATTATAGKAASVSRESPTAVAFIPLLKAHCTRGKVSRVEGRGQLDATQPQ